MTPPDPRAWRVAIALGLEMEPPLDWARWAAGLTALPCTCGTWGDGALLVHSSCFHHGNPRWSGGRGVFRDGPPKVNPTPVPAPWDADAYRADAARRGVWPGPMPSLSFTVDNIRVVVSEFGEFANIVVESATGGHVRAHLGSEGTMHIGQASRCLPADLALLSRLATAAAKAMAQP